MLKALVIRQPHAGRVAAGVKRIECRRWRTRHRGPLLVCADGRPVCLVDLVDVRPLTRADLPAACAAPGAAALGWAWLLADPRPVPPAYRRPVRGLPGLFSVSPG
jgi:hypothetical protein